MPFGSPRGGVPGWSLDAATPPSSESCSGGLGILRAAGILRDEPDDNEPEDNEKELSEDVSDTSSRVGICRYFCLLSAVYKCAVLSSRYYVVNDVMSLPRVQGLLSGACSNSVEVVRVMEYDPIATKSTMRADARLLYAIALAVSSDIRPFPA